MKRYIPINSKMNRPKKLFYFRLLGTIMAQQLKKVNATVSPAKTDSIVSTWRQFSNRILGNGHVRLEIGSGPLHVLVS